MGENEMQEANAKVTQYTVYPKKYAHGFVVLCFVVVMHSFIINSHEVFIHIHQGCFAGTKAIVRLPQCQWSKPDGYGKISQCITTTKHSKAKTVCIFLGIYCTVQQLCQARLCNTRLWYFSIHFIKTQVELLTTLWHGYQFYMLNTHQVFLGIRHEKVKYHWSRLGVKSLSNKKPSYYWIIVSSIVLFKVVF